jgi:saccharopine dehydrogenase-like NADP-dependent oxidoreductase
MPASILVLGGGKIGAVVAELLAHATTRGRADYRVTLADRNAAALAAAPRHARIDTRVVDVEDAAALAAALQGRTAVLSALPYRLTVRVAEAARAAGCHYLDLTEDVASTRRIREIADGAPRAFIPQCGLAPGFVGIVAADLARRFERLDSVRMRVGALPTFPSNSLNYNLTWSTEGVINEYCEPCEAIVDSQRVMVPALEEREEFSLDGVLYEAFNTSGGLGTLCETLEGRVRTLNYRTIRYPGHAAVMKTLLHDLRLKDRRELLKDILENALPATTQDVVIVFVTAAGVRADEQGQPRFLQDTVVRKIYSRALHGTTHSAIQITTASALCATLDLLLAGKLPQAGFVRQEQTALEDFLGNRFGAVYAEPAASKLAA